MRKLIVPILLIIYSQNAISQQFEIGPDFGCNFVNVANSEITQGRAVIGKSLFSTSEGISILYYFRDPRKNITNGIRLGFLNSNRGVQSDNYSESKFEFNSKSINLLYRRAGVIGNKFGIYMEAGFGYNVFDNNTIYKGNVDELVAFNKLTERLIIRSNEIAFLYGLGFDRTICKDKFICFFQFNGDAGISKINVNSGAFRTQSLGGLIGFRYVIKTGK
jgi:hypothetical protein